MIAYTVGRPMRHFGLPLARPWHLLQRPALIVDFQTQLGLWRFSPVLCGLPNTLSPLPSWDRRVMRYIARDQDQARLWHRDGLPLGRLVMIAEGPWEHEALGAVVTEVRAMWR